MQIIICEILCSKLYLELFMMKTYRWQKGGGRGVEFVVMRGGERRDHLSLPGVSCYFIFIY